MPAARPAAPAPAAPCPGVRAIINFGKTPAVRPAAQASAAPRPAGQPTLLTALSSRSQHASQLAGATLAVCRGCLALPLQHRLSSVLCCHRLQGTGPVRSSRACAAQACGRLRREAGSANGALIHWQALQGTSLEQLLPCQVWHACVERVSWRAVTPRRPTVNAPAYHRSLVRSVQRSEV